MNIIPVVLKSNLDKKSDFQKWGETFQALDSVDVKKSSRMERSSFKSWGETFWTLEDMDPVPAN